MHEYTDPAETLALLDKLEAMGFPDSAFAMLHHFEEAVKIASHRRYCEMLRREGASFRTSTNQLVQKRLGFLARIYEAGPFKCNSSALFEQLSGAVLLEIPHDREAPSEQDEVAGPKAEGHVNRVV